MTRMKLRLGMLILICIILPTFAQAVSIGISPGRVKFDNLLRGGYAERTVKVTTNSIDDITGYFEVSGEISDWLRFEPNSTYFNVSSSHPFSLKIKITPPNDTASGSYSGMISFTTDRLGSPQGRAGSLIKAAVALTLDASVTHTQTIECSAGGFNIKDLEIDYPLEVTYTIRNEGNVRISPQVKLDVWDQLQENLILSKEFKSPEVLPTVQEAFTQILPSQNIGIGQYWGTISIDDCKAGSLLSFSVVEKGGIIDKGILEQVTNKVWAYVEEPIEITATFRNTGPRIVTAQFRGSIKLDDKIAQVIESEEVDVESGESVDLTSFFTPETSGRFVVTGRVYYNKKLTFEKGSIINVNPKTDEKSNPRFILLLIYLLILITIVFIARRIIKERQKT
jgi:hypothetical protein